MHAVLRYCAHDMQDSLSGEEQKKLVHSICSPNEVSNATLSLYYQQLSSFSLTLSWNSLLSKRKLGYCKTLYIWAILISQILPTGNSQGLKFCESRDGFAKVTQTSESSSIPVAPCRSKTWRPYVPGMSQYNWVKGSMLNGKNFPAV